MARKAFVCRDKMSAPLLKEYESGNDMVSILYWLLWQECGEQVGGC